MRPRQYCQDECGVAPLGKRSRVSMVRPIEQIFPGLHGTLYQVTSPQDEAYNCIAWAAGDNQLCRDEKPQMQLRMPQMHRLPLVVRQPAEEVVRDGRRGGLEAVEHAAQALLRFIQRYELSCQRSA